MDSEADGGGFLALLTTALSPFKSCTSTLSTTFSFIYSVSFLLGKLVTLTLLNTFFIISTALQSIATALLILLEDFRYFASDMEVYLTTLFTALDDLCEWTIGAFYSLSFPSFALPSPILIAKETFETLASTLFKWAVTLKSSIILIGELVWSLTVLFIELILTVLILTPINVCIFLWTSLTTIYNFIWDCFSSVPLQSICGLAVIGLLYFTFICFGGHVILLSYLKRTVCLVVKTISTIYFGIILSVHLLGWRVASALLRLGAVRRILKIISNRAPFSANLPRASLIAELELEKSEKLCVACLDQKKTILLLNCNHLCLCVRCAGEVSSTSNRCPICRSPVLEMINVYI